MYLLRCLLNLGIGVGALMVGNAEASQDASSPPLAQTPLRIDATTHAVVLEYEAWFGPSLLKPTAGYFPQLTSPNMEKDKGYDSHDPAIVEHHIKWFEELGVDAVLVEESNGGPCGFGNDDTCRRAMKSERTRSGWEDPSVSDKDLKAYQAMIHGINASTEKVYSDFRARSTQIKIISMMDGQDPEMYDPEPNGETAFDQQVKHLLSQIDTYPELSVLYEDKPLILIYVATDASTYHPKALQASQRWASRATFRIVTGFQDSQPYLWEEGQGLHGLHKIKYENMWTWIDRFNPEHGLLPGYKMSGTRTEAFTVFGAAGGTVAPDGWHAADATLWNDGETLKKMMNFATELSPNFLIFNQFNEFSAGDQGPDYEHSNDIEPTKEWGPKKFHLAKDLIHQYQDWAHGKEAGVQGMIDEVNEREIRGWACDKFFDESLQVHLYVGGPAGDGGQLLKTANSTLTNELAINQNCRANGRTYRFSIPLDQETLSANAGRMIYVHGIAKGGGANKLLDNPSQLTFPETVAKKATASRQVYRKYNQATGEHMYTNIAEEASDGGFTLEGVAFIAFAPGTPGTVPIYRCYQSGMHYISPLANCEGGTTESSLGNVYTRQEKGTTPLYRMFNSSSGDHMVTIDEAETTAAGYIAENPIGYVTGP